MPKAKTYTAYGVTKSIPEWAKQSGLTPQAIRHRIRAGWTMEEALTGKRSVSGRPLKIESTFAGFDLIQRQHEHMRKQLEAMFRKFIRNAQLQLGALGADYINSVRDQADTMARDAVKDMPGVGKNFAKKRPDRSSPTAQDRG